MAPGPQRRRSWALGFDRKWGSLGVDVLGGRGIKKPTPIARCRRFNPKKPSLGSPGRWFLCVWLGGVVVVAWDGRAAPAGQVFDTSFPDRQERYRTQSCASGGCFQRLRATLTQAWAKLFLRLKQSKHRKYVKWISITRVLS